MVYRRGSEEWYWIVVLNVTFFGLLTGTAATRKIISDDIAEEIS